MKIVITGSLGYVGRHLVNRLLEDSHTLTIISSSVERGKEIEALGCTAAIGKMEDVDFLTETFTGADAVFCMISPSGGFTDPNFGVTEIIANAKMIAENYREAILKSGVKRIVYLSSVGAHLSEGNGLLVIHHYAENILNQLPADVSISFMRPVGFYKNLFAFIPSIKSQHVIASNYGGKDLSLLVSPVDIASAITEELTTEQLAGRKIRYVASEERTCDEVAKILGDATGNPDLKWIIITDEQLLGGLRAFGMNESIAKAFVEMNANTHAGKIHEDYLLHRPKLGVVKLTEFAKEFAIAYNN